MDIPKVREAFGKLRRRCITHCRAQGCYDPADLADIEAEFEDALDAPDVPTCGDCPGIAALREEVAKARKARRDLAVRVRIMPSPGYWRTMAEDRGELLNLVACRRSCPFRKPLTAGEPVDPLEKGREHDGLQADAEAVLAEPVGEG